MNSIPMKDHWKSSFIFLTKTFGGTILAWLIKIWTKLDVQGNGEIFHPYLQGS